MEKIVLGTWYLLNVEGQYVQVLPFKGEDIGHLGVSGGFIHYFTKDGTIGFCGTDYFIKNSIDIIKLAQR